MNWGKGLIVAFLAFAAFIVYFVVKGIAYNRTEVPVKYYEKGLKYQEEINAEELGEKAKVELKNIGKGRAQIVFKDVKPDSGFILFIWPPDEKQNTVTQLKGNDRDTLLVDVMGPEGKRNVEFRFFKKGAFYVIHDQFWKE